MKRKILFWIASVAIASSWIGLLSEAGWKGILYGIISTIFTITAVCCRTSLELEKEKGRKKDEQRKKDV